MNQTLESTWEALQHATPDPRRQCIASLRADPSARGALLEAVFTTPSARFLRGEGASLPDVSALIAYQQRSSGRWARGRGLVGAGFRGLYVGLGSARTAPWLWLQADGVLTSASVMAVQAHKETAESVKRWLGIGDPRVFESSRSLGVWQADGRGVRLFSASRSAVVLYQGAQEADGLLHLEGLSLANGHCSVRRFQRV